MPALGVLRAWAEAELAPAPARPRRLGRRGGRALRPQPVRQLRLRGHARPGRGRATSATPTGSTLAEALAENGVELDAGPRAPVAGPEGLGAYLELHIEQGPVLEAEGLAVRRGRGLRRGRAVAALRSAARPPTPARRRWTRGATPASPPRRPRSRSSASPPSTAGSARPARCGCEPGISPRSPGEAELSVDLRHREAGPRSPRCSRRCARRPREAAERRGCELGRGAASGGSSRSRSTPSSSDARARPPRRPAAEREPLTSGALHDAAEVARCVPAAMIFSSSIGGPQPHRRRGHRRAPTSRVAIEAFGGLVARALRAAG